MGNTNNTTNKKDNKKTKTILLTIASCIGISLVLYFILGLISIATGNKIIQTIRLIVPLLLTIFSPVIGIIIAIEKK